MTLSEWITKLIEKYRKRRDSTPKPEPTPRPEPKPEPRPEPKPPPATKTKTETGRYHGRYNGDRPTWYFSRNIADYPRSLTLTIPGCYEKLQITHNGVRYERSGIILKQSDVKGRGMALVVPASCKSTTARIEY